MDSKIEDSSSSSSSSSSSNRPSVSFPLGLSILCVFLFCISTFFFWCFHWDKIRSLLFHYSPQHNTDFFPTSPQMPIQIAKQKQPQSLSVVMPGDLVPKFIALSCPPKPAIHAKGKIHGCCSETII